MGISFNFNDQYLAEMEEIERKIDAERATMTVEERQAEKQQLEIEFKQILKKAEDLLTENQKNIDGKKIEEFKATCKLAFAISGILNLNIDIKESANGLYGAINIKADYIMILKEAPIEAKKGFAMLIAAATETIISGKEDNVEINLRYDFYE